MTRIVYVNGRYLPYGEAAVHVEDRGFQFGDAIYEVCEVIDGRLIDEPRHMARLERSLNELQIPQPMSQLALAHVMRQVIKRNRVRDGLVYLQVSRGAAPRDFYFPGPDVLPTVVCLARPMSRAVPAANALKGIAIKSMPDIRWQRCDIKTVMLLPACLAKEAARADGAKEAWFVDGDGFVTEGASSNAWIVAEDGTLVTRQLSSAILPGVTRTTLLDVLHEEGMVPVERPFRLSEAYAAREAFITSATQTVMPVVRIDGNTVGDGRPGPIAQRLRNKFHQFAAISGT
ncbi:D-amino-acid transaminase [Hyphomicrobium sulfonivorans]|uniref:D-amino-acid transaminase n=1 Tax=Hyphomicrobium sulfonivorans TaxID=121290 RepID=UPI00156DCC4F|nr:D-amino-acid transaminase [Hyphomicrobium sulfonivorans]MBI1650520.1 D-amino-acid transaminase [Hyphomicrobium sulfonivorans]NSL72122.1 D-amino acid aminotransferase [Hyphomicrobium sulfonivorans]